MKETSYIIAKINQKIFRKSKDSFNDYFRKQGMKIGKKCNICSNIVMSESWLVEIGDNTTIAGNVKLVTHDNSISKVLPNATDLFGKIIIGNNCFIGVDSVIMYGVELADNIIVASGSVVTKSFKDSNIIIAGNPAKVITTWDSFAKKSKEYAWNLSNIDKSKLCQMQSDSKKLIRR